MEIVRTEQTYSEANKGTNTSALTSNSGGEIWSPPGASPNSKILAWRRRNRRLARRNPGGALNHPNLVTIHELGSQQGYPYILVELLEGETLRARLTGAAMQSLRKGKSSRVALARRSDTVYLR